MQILVLNLQQVAVASFLLAADVVEVVMVKIGQHTLVTAELVLM
jgi:hypothetical protein